MLRLTPLHASLSACCYMHLAVHPIGKLAYMLGHDVSATRTENAPPDPLSDLNSYLADPFIYICQQF